MMIVFYKNLQELHQSMRKLIRAGTGASTWKENYQHHFTIDD